MVRVIRAMARRWFLEKRGFALERPRDLEDFDSVTNSLSGYGLCFVVLLIVFVVMVRCLPRVG